MVTCSPDPALRVRPRAHPVGWKNLIVLTRSALQGPVHCHNLGFRLAVGCTVYGLVPGQTDLLDPVASRALETAFRASRSTKINTATPNGMAVNATRDPSEASPRITQVASRRLKAASRQLLKGLYPTSGRMTARRRLPSVTSRLRFDIRWGRPQRPRPRVQHQPAPVQADRERELTAGSISSLTSLMHHPRRQLGGTSRTLVSVTQSCLRICVDEESR
jgi:hypothetical protein